MNPICNSVHVRVPATSANLGSGFDTVGLALDYHDELTFTLNDDPNVGIAHVIIHGEGADALPCDETHLVVSTFRRACATFGLGRLGFTLEATNNIPQARGMGSSAEAIVAGIAAAAAFAQTGDLNRPAVFDMAAQIEGHPDNVAPAVFGGLTVSWDFETAEGVGSVAVPGGEPLHGGFHAVNYPVDPSITAAVFVPDYELSTEKARQALPRELPYKDAVYNVSRVGLLPAAMNPVVLAQAAQQGKSGVAAAPAQDADTCACSGGTRESAFADELAAAQAQSNALLFTATQDKLHQPYRGALMPPSTELIALFRSKGYAAAVSGAGPCVLVLHYGNAPEAQHFGAAYAGGFGESPQNGAQFADHGENVGQGFYSEAPLVAATFPSAPEGTSLRTVGDGGIEASSPDGGNTLWYNSAYYQEPDAPHSVMQSSNGVDWYAMQQQGNIPQFEVGEAAAAYNQAAFQNFMPGYDLPVSQVDGTHRQDGYFEVRHEDGSGTKFYDIARYAAPRGDYQVFEDSRGSQWYAIQGDAAVDRKPVYENGKPVYDNGKLRTTNVETIRYKQTPTRFAEPEKRGDIERKPPKRKM